MRKKLSSLLRIILSLSLIFYLLAIVDIRSLGDRLLHAEIPWLVFAYVLVIGQTAMSALKWKIRLRF